MGRGRWAGVALSLCVLGGCTSHDDDGVRAAPSARTTATTAPPAADPPSPPPPTALHGSVDLSTAVPGVPVAGTAVVATADGSAYVLLNSTELRRPAYLATVGREGGALAVTGTATIPRLRPVWGMHALADGTVLVTGQFTGRQPGYGYLAVDPGSGRTRSAVVIPFEEGTDLAQGASAVSADGSTVHLLLSSFVDGRQLNLLVAADVATGDVLAGRDLFLEVREVSRAGIGPYTAWLFARSGGGVSVVFDAYPADAGIHGVPTVLRYDATLEPDGPAVAMAGHDDRAQLQAAAVASDGTVWVSAETPDATWLLSAPADGSAQARLPLAGQDYADGLAIAPTSDWAVALTEDGARAVDLATGGTAALDVGCAEPPDVTAVASGLGDVGVLVVGRCEARPPSAPMLWMTRPAG
jgi:hypothetical protein